MRPRANEVVLVQPRRSILGALFFFAGATAVGVWFSMDPDWRAWLVVIGGGALTFVSLLQLCRPGKMTINNEGFGRTRSPLTPRCAACVWGLTAPTSEYRDNPSYGERKTLRGVVQVVADRRPLPRLTGCVCWSRMISNSGGTRTLRRGNHAGYSRGSWHGVSCQTIRG